MDVTTAESRASASAPTADADGRKVLGDGRAALGVIQDGCSGAQDQNLAALGADGAPSPQHTQKSRVVRVMTR